MTTRRECGCTAARIRAWARQDGISIADRGSVPWRVHELYHEAHDIDLPGRPQAGPGSRTAVAWRRAGLASLVALTTSGVVALPAAADEIPLVEVTGAPLVHHFDLGVPGDAVTGRWQIAATSADPVPYDGVLTTYGPVSPSLARALHVQYGQLDGDGRVRAWFDAGTLADPVSLGDALPDVGPVGAGTPVTVPVRVRLPDPQHVTGEAGDLLEVEAVFTVSYLGQGQVAAGDQQDLGLAATGVPTWVVAVAAAALAAGLLARRRNGPVGGVPTP